MNVRVPSVMTIAGSDSGGGAGIQADLKTFAAHGIHGLCVIAALTAQNTQGVSAVHVPPVTFLREQLKMCFADFDVRAIKVGMLANAEVIRTVATVLDEFPDVPVVLDPVMIATSGARLLEEDAIAALRALLARAQLLTPNIPEAEFLLGRVITTPAGADEALRLLRMMGPRAVLLKGAHLAEGGIVRDRYAGEDGEAVFEHPRIGGEAHGTGCTLASAIAANIGLGFPPREACQRATDYVARALASGQQPGCAPLMVLDHFGAAPRD